MAINGSAMYGLTLEKQFKKTQAGDMESTSVFVLLVTDSYAPDPDVDAFVTDLTNEIANGNGYTTGGKALAATPSWTVATPAAGQISYDSADPAWAASTITSAMAAVLYHTTGSTATDELYLLSDFTTAVSTSNGTLTVQVDANGWVYFDHSTI
jgi:hypothetical protein